MHRATVDVYEREAVTYAERRPARGLARAAAFAAHTLPGRPVLDAGCGPGKYLGTLDAAPSASVAIGLDAATAMIDLARVAAPGVPLLQADLEALPFRRAALGGAWARKSYLHLPRASLPCALADLQRTLAVDAPFDISVMAGNDTEGPWPDDDIPGRFFARWDASALVDVIEGAGFGVESLVHEGDTLSARCRRLRTLPDTVSPAMRLLVCGLNPSLVAADAGVGYAGPTNRFWPAAIAAQVVDKPRDPFHALRACGVGMTDLVKRASVSASDLTAPEYRLGTQRVARLLQWLRPGVVVFVGLAGFRAAVDAGAVPGPQPAGFAGSRAYLMPSTSGRNAHARFAELVEHLRAAARLAADYT
jgi:TDG/mug DNA glycosylase family protein